MNQFINTKDTLVTEAIDGLLKTSGGRLNRLDGYPHIKVVCRADWDKSRVALISGGGSGHEPAHAGFVGEGMLTAAVCGEVFASPSVAERARAFGLKVSMMVVDDDIALPDLPQARGVAGTLLVHKIAGALAEDGADLDTVTAAAAATIGNLASIGMSLDTCTVPGSAKEERIAGGMAELGLGILGEAGVEQVAFETARSAMGMVMDKLSAHLTGPSVALLNNLGSTTPLEMSILAEELLRADTAGHIALMVGPAALMTSLDMHGFSVTILPVTPEHRALLTRPVPMPAWPGTVAVQAPEVLPLPDGLSPIQPIPSQNDKVRGVIESCCALLIASETVLNELDAKSGDGDTGSTLATASRALVEALDRMPLADLTQLFRAISNELSQTMGGSSGVILAIFFGATGDACANGQSTAEALQSGLARIGQVGGAKLGDRTMIDALEPALEALPQGVAAAAQAARAGANATARMGRAKAGRASYVPEENLIGHNDPGAEAVARMFEGLAETL